MQQRLGWLRHTSVRETREEPQHAIRNHHLSCNIALLSACRIATDRREYHLTKSIAAPPATVFDAASDLANLHTRIPDIVSCEVLTSGPVGLGTRYKETRKMFGKRATETFEIVAYQPPSHFAMKAISCGVEYVAEHDFTADNNGLATVMQLTIKTKSITLFAKIMAPLFSWMMTGATKKAIMRDLDHLAKSLEEPTPSPEVA